MWTDGRYYIQAEKTLFDGWEMMKMERGQVDLKSYIKNNLPKGATVGIDTKLVSSEFFEELQNFLKDYKLVHDEENLIDKIWKEKRDYNKDKVILHKTEFCGESCEKKFNRVSDFVKSFIPEVQKFALLITRLDDIAWITNLRGADIPYNPVFFSYAILLVDTHDNKIKLNLYSNKEKFDAEEIHKHLEENRIKLFNYPEIYDNLINDEELKKYTIISDKASLNQYLFNLIQKHFTTDSYKILEKNAVEHIKSVKSEREIKGLRECNIRDGAALIKYFAWLENELTQNNKTDLNEYQAALKIREFRSFGEHFMGESFEAISATGSNAAIIHYKPDEKASSVISKENIYLLDSGGQYLDGTTDTTRTVHFGTPTKEEKEMYTRVLLGNLSLQRSRIMKRWNPDGGHIDALARQFLWHQGLEYLHGTGHGVGYFLNVHEGPHGIGHYPNNPPLLNGMVVTNEPGYYLKDKFGIRIENMLLVKEESGLICFENLTIVPYESSLFDFYLISDDFLHFINEYHKECFEKLSPFLEDNSLAMNYLKRKTCTIVRK